MINTEKEIKAHLLEWSHCPNPTLHVEEDMCACDKCPHYCGNTLSFKDTYTQSFHEFATSIDLSKEKDKEWIQGKDSLTLVDNIRQQNIMRNIETISRPQFEKGNYCPIGAPPNAEPNDRIIPGWYEHRIINNK